MYLFILYIRTTSLQSTHYNIKLWFYKKNLNALIVKKNKHSILLDMSINNATTLKTITLQII